MNYFESGKGEDLGIEKLKPDFRMQVDLALRFYGISKDGLIREDLDSYFLKWVEYNDNQFPRDFRNMLKQHPELLTEYQTGPESALNKVEGLLYTPADTHK